MTGERYLAPSDLRELTGRAQAKAQICWLRSNRWRFAVTDDGAVRVTWEYWRMRLGADPREPAANDDQDPDFSSLTPAA